MSPPEKPLRVSIVTPSFNRIRFLKAAMDSVLDQKYPALEYAVVDGGSTDGSADLIGSYGDRLAWWVSERDGGQYDAINKGFAHTSGEIMAWLNSDDLYLPWAFALVADIFAALPEVEWLATAFPVIWNEAGQAVYTTYRPGYSSLGFRRGEYLPTLGRYTSGYIQQETTFWRRSLWDRCGGALDTAYHVAADYDLWMRFSEQAQLYAVSVPLGFPQARRSAGRQRIGRVRRGGRALPGCARRPAVLGRRVVSPAPGRSPAAAAAGAGCERGPDRQAARPRAARRSLVHRGAMTAIFEAQ